MADRRYATLRASERFNALENIVTQTRGSFLLVVTGEDPSYVVGYYADIRGLVVNDEMVRLPKPEILLRISVAAELRPDPNTLQYGGTATG